MSRKTLFSVHNQVEVDPGGIEHFELNPAVVAGEHAGKYALSAVCLGPLLVAEGESLTLSLSIAEERVELESLMVRSEPTANDRHLTVALFAASHRILAALSASDDVEVLLRGANCNFRRPFDPQNRRNVMSFLSHPDLMASAQGTESIAV